MSEHEHSEQADRLEREADDMAQEGERVDGHIAEARADWEQRKADPAVPGAGGDPLADADEEHDESESEDADSEATA